MLNNYEKDISNNKIAENLKKLRAKKELSLVKIVQLADLSLNTIVKVENGVTKNPTIETQTKIAKAIEVGVDDLIKEKYVKKHSFFFIRNHREGL